MKVSLYTITLNGGYYGGPAVPLLDIFPKARRWGYDGIEIEAKRPHGNPMDLDAADRKAICKAARDNGLVISCVAAYNDYSSPIDEHRENELLMTREQIRLAADLGCPVVRVFAAWSGVSRRDGCITYDVARHNQRGRYPGTTELEKWGYVRDALAEAAAMAAKHGVTLALQNHTPVIESHKDMLAFIREVNSPALKACLDAPCMACHGEEAYRQALQDTGDLLVHTHYGGRFVELPDGTVEPDSASQLVGRTGADMPAFLRLARQITGFSGHVGYELCSPVLTDHRHAGLEYAMKQAELACKYVRRAIDSLPAQASPVPGRR
jgi:sugar phosphate isomerase/epimerase